MDGVVGTQPAASSYHGLSTKFTGFGSSLLMEGHELLLIRRYIGLVGVIVVVLGRRERCS